MFLSNLSECLPRNSLTSSMVFREKGSEGAEGSSAKEMEGQAGYSVRRFLTDGRAGRGRVGVISFPWFQMGLEPRFHERMARDQGRR